jgi:hypothetical protein
VKPISSGDISPDVLTEVSDLGNVRGAVRMRRSILKVEGTIDAKGPACRALCLNLPGTPNRNLPTLGLGLRYRNVDFVAKAQAAKSMPTLINPESDM